MTMQDPTPDSCYRTGEFRPHDSGGTPGASCDGGFCLADTCPVSNCTETSPTHYTRAPEEPTDCNSPGQVLWEYTRGVNAGLTNGSFGSSADYCFCWRPGVAGVPVISSAPTETGCAIAAPFNPRGRCARREGNQTAGPGTGMGWRESQQWVNRRATPMIYCFSERGTPRLGFLGWSLWAGQFVSLGAKRGQELATPGCGGYIVGATNDN